MAGKSKNNLRVLIADDDKDDRYFLDLAFKEADLGHIATFVADGDELLQYLEKTYSSGRIVELPDLIMLDLNMPKKDGREALKEIKSDSRFRDLNVVIFSTTISDQDKTYTAALGASDHIIKPFDFSELVHTVRNICDACILAA